MIGIVLVLMKCVIGNCLKRLRQDSEGCVSHSFNCTRCFNNYTLVTRQGISILKVGMALCIKILKKERAVPWVPRNLK